MDLWDRYQFFSPRRFRSNAILQRRVIYISVRLRTVNFLGTISAKSIPDLLIALNSYTASRQHAATKTGFVYRSINYTSSARSGERVTFREMIDRDDDRRYHRRGDRERDLHLQREIARRFRMRFPVKFPSESRLSRFGNNWFNLCSCVRWHFFGTHVLSHRNWLTLSLPVNRYRYRMTFETRGTCSFLYTLTYIISK